MQSFSGVLAQLARAIGSQSIGQGFDSPILHTVSSRRPVARCFFLFSSTFLPGFHGRRATNCYLCGVEFVDFILAHEGDDTVRLLLSRDRFPEVDMDLAASTIEARRRLKAKLPEWYAVPSLHYPSRLSAEQCSSSATARYKARLAAGTVANLAAGNDEGVVAGPVATLGRVRGRGPSFGWEGSRSDGLKATPSSNNKAAFRIADLTGGLGVDSWAFSQVAEEVLYNEREEKLVEAARHNFSELGLKNVRISNAVIEKGKAGEVLGDFNPDLIYMDPARRAVDGRKVFLLEDCSPDVTALLPELFELSRYVLLKLSPMADISMLERRLPGIREIHIVATEGECREVLLLLERGWDGPGRMFIAEDDAVMEIPREGRKYRAALQFKEYLFEPGKALLKSGAFDLPCSYGLE